MRSTPPSTTPKRSNRLRRAAIAALAVGAAIAAPTVAADPDRADAAELTFPFTTTFDDTGGGTLFGDARVDGGWLELTSAANSQAGSWSTDGVFPSSLGLEIEFRYAMWGGSGGADGLLLSLSDGAAPQGVGQRGASLGYVCDDSTMDFGPCDRPGLPGGYVGIAFDRYGNFSRSLNGTGTGRAPDTIALRGAGNGTEGYRFLQNAPVPGGVATENRANAAVVRITLLPNDHGHTTLTVRTTTPTHKDPQTIIDHVALEGAGQGPLPETLRLGLAASTGSFTNRHEVAQLSVWVPTDLRAEHAMPTPVAGKPYAYDVIMRNDGPNDAVGAETRLDVPAALGADARWTCAADDGGRGGADGAGGAAAGRAAACGTAEGAVVDGRIASTADLPAGTSVRYTVHGTLAPDAAGALDTRAEIVPPPSRADLDENNNVSRGSTSITADASIVTAKTVSLVDGATELLPGDDVEYTVTATNRGPSVAMDVGAEDPLPEQLTFAGSDDNCAAEGQLVTCRSTGALGVDQDRVFRFRATLDPAYEGDGSDVVNIATGTSPTDPGGGDPSDPVVLPPVGGGSDPEPTPQPTATPTAGPDNGRSDDGPRDRGAGVAAARSAGGGELAYTGAEGLLALGIASTLALGVGTVVAVRRRLRR